MSHRVIKKLAPNQQLYPHDSVKAKLRFQAFSETRWATHPWVPRKHQATHRKAKRGVKQTNPVHRGLSGDFRNDLLTSGIQMEDKKQHVL